MRNTLIAIVLVLLGLAGAAGYYAFSLKGEVAKLRDDMSKATIAANQQRTESEKRRGELEAEIAKHKRDLEAPDGKLKVATLTAEKRVEDKFTEEGARLKRELESKAVALKALEEERNKLANEASQKAAMAEKLAREAEDLRKNNKKLVAKDQAETENKKKLDEELRKSRRELNDAVVRDFKIVEDLEEYKNCKSRQLIIAYRPRKRDEVLAIAKELGLEKIKESQLLNSFVFGWPEDKPITRKTLDTLKTHKAAIRIVEPNQPIELNGLDPIPKMHRAEPLLRDADPLLRDADPSFGPIPLIVQTFDWIEDFFTARIPADPKYAEQWGLTLIRAPFAWNTVHSCDPGVVVAVIDTGIDLEHEDFGPNVFTSDSQNFLVEDNVAEDDPMRANPRPQACSDLKDHNKFYSHGTQIAGIIGASGNNKIGVSGVAWNVKIMALRAVGRYPENGPAPSPRYGQAHELAEAIKYAVNHGASVINCSFSSPRPTEELKQACQLAERNGVLIVCAAGNRRQNNSVSTSQVYPASFRMSNIISVGAISVKKGNSGLPEVSLWVDMDADGKPAESGSGYGKDSVHICAPGGYYQHVKGRSGILSTAPASEGEGYRSASGTSAATAFVSGAAALALSHPNHRLMKPGGDDYREPHRKTPVEIKKLLLDKARKVPSLKEQCIEGRILDIGFLAEVKEPTVSPAAMKAFLEGYHRYWRGDHIQASPLFMKSIQKDNNFAPAYYYLAFCRACAGKYKSANEYLKMGLEREKLKTPRRSETFSNWSFVMERFQGIHRSRMESLRLASKSGQEIVLDEAFWTGWTCPKLLKGPPAKFGGIYQLIFESSFWELWLRLQNSCSRESILKSMNCDCFRQNTPALTPGSEASPRWILAPSGATK